MRCGVTLFAASMLLCAVSYGQQPAAQEPQDETQQQPAPPPPSLGDVARQLKLKKQQREAQLKQAKAASTPDAPASDATPDPEPPKTAHLVTTDDAPERATVTPVSTHTTNPEPVDAKPSTDDHKPGDAEKWKSQIRELKSAISALQQDIKSTSDSIHFAGANCVANCAQWNDRQQQKQQEVDTMKAQLEEGQKQLQEMQEAARKEGFGSSVYDP